MENIYFENGCEEDLDVITKLRLVDKNLTSLDIELLNKLTKLEFLDVSKNKLKLLSGINLPNLKILNCEDNSISDITFVNQLPNLEKLYLNGNPINAADRYIAVDKLPNLKIFDEKSCTDIRAIISHYEERLNTLAIQIFKSKYERILKSCFDEDEVTRHQKQCIREVQHKMASFSVTPPKFQRYKVQSLVNMLFEEIFKTVKTVPVKQNIEKISYPRSSNSPRFKRSSILIEKSPVKKVKEKEKQTPTIIFEVENKSHARSCNSPGIKRRSEVLEQKLPIRNAKENGKKTSRILFGVENNVEEDNNIKLTPKKVRKSECKHISGRNQLNYDPYLFLRCHVPTNDPHDANTQVWGAAFEPDIEVKGNVTDIVATCGGNTVCFISCKTGHVLKRYKNDSNSENLFALSWTVVQVNGNEQQKTSVLATGGAEKRIILIHPSQLKSYLSFKAHNKAINCLQFHQTQTTWLFSGSPDTFIHLWDTGAFSLPDYKTSYQKLMTFQPGSEVLQLVLADKHSCFFAGCSQGLMVWNIAEKAVKKCARTTSINLLIPKICKREENDCNLIDGLALVPNDCMAVKVSQSGKIFLWKISNIFTKGQLHKKKTYEIVPIAIFSWSDCSTDYNYFGYCEGNHALACGDNKGALWLYDVQKYSENSQIAPQENCIPPTVVLPWPCLTFENEKLPVQKQIIVNSVEFSFNGEYLVACTGSNLVCIWRKTLGS